MLTYIQQNGAVGKSIPYPSSTHPKATIASSGCGVCSSLMVLLNSTSYPRTLKWWTKRLVKAGARKADGTDMNVVADMMCNRYGFTCKKTRDIAELKKHLQNGYKAVLHEGQKGYFSSSGHFVCAAGIRPDGTAIILDPYYYSNKWTSTVNGIDRSKYFKYNKETHEVYCNFNTIQRDRRGYYYLFIPHKKVALKYANDDVHSIKFGVDISEHNGKVNFKELKNDVDFVFLRLGWTGNKNNHTLDKTFEYNYKWAKKRGIPVGVYVYLYNNSVKTAQDGAKWVVKQLNGRKLNLPVFADMEDKSIASLGKGKLTDITDVFNEVIQRNGYRAGVYAGKNWFDNKLDTAMLKKKYPIWVADYRYPETDYKYSDTYAMWQFAENGKKVSGVKGDVDKDLMYVDLIDKA